MSTLLVIRHAQAQAFAARDHDRALTADGAASARAVGRLIARTGPPDLALVSTARRARETLTAAMEGGGWAAPTVALDGLYGATPDAVVVTLASHGGDASTVLVVGHEPCCSGLVQVLSGARVRMATAALASMQVGPAWDVLDPDWCRLQWFASPALTAVLARGRAVRRR